MGIPPPSAGRSNPKILPQRHQASRSDSLDGGTLHDCRPSIGSDREDGRAGTGDDESSEGVSRSSGRYRGSSMMSTGTVRDDSTDRNAVSDDEEVVSVTALRAQCTELLRAKIILQNEMRYVSRISRRLESLGALGLTMRPSLYVGSQFRRRRIRKPEGRLPASPSMVPLLHMEDETTPPSPAASELTEEDSDVFCELPDPFDSQETLMGPKFLRLIDKAITGDDNSEVIQTVQLDPVVVAVDSVYNTCLQVTAAQRIHIAFDRVNHDFKASLQDVIASLKQSRPDLFDSQSSPDPVTMLSDLLNSSSVPHSLHVLRNSSSLE